LQELREARQISQVQLAAKLKINQSAVSKLEKQTDVYISSLRHCIEALGGSLDIRAVFPDGDVRISQFVDRKAAKTRARPARRDRARAAAG
jgi:transcriptional regulator with XRE-family HTH domain